MVNPIYLFVAALGGAFLIGPADKVNKNLSFWLTVMIVGVMAWISGSWFHFIEKGGESAQVFTAGLRPPVSINLMLGYKEAFILVLSNVAGLLGIFALRKRFMELPAYAMMLYVAMLTGVNGIVMTRDIFNLFVFIEINSIATYALIALEPSRKALSAGFKYMIAGGIASILFLLGTIYIYRLGGTLNIDQLAMLGIADMGKAGWLAAFLLFSSILIELKPFPANGWALDVYQSAHGGVLALISSANAGAMFYALYKVMPILGDQFLGLLAVVGLVTFFFSNLLGTRQHNFKRLLGYSSVGQIGLMMGVYALLTKLGMEQARILIITGAIFVNHFLAKAGLFWMAETIEGEDLTAWGVLRRNPEKLFSFGILLFSLAGFPPFPMFWAKWNIVMGLAEHGSYVALATILLGSMFEIFMLLRWLGVAAKTKTEKESADHYGLEISSRIFMLALIVIGLRASGFFIVNSFNMNTYMLPASAVAMTPLIAGAFIYLIDWLGVKIKAVLTIVLTGVYLYFIIPAVLPLPMLFTAVFGLGGIIIAFASMYRKINVRGFYPLLTMLILSLVNITIANSTLEFFTAWEFMTLSSYLLLMQGKNAQEHALRYVMFSMGAAFLIMTGFAVLYANTGVTDFASLLLGRYPFRWSFILIGLGMLVKMGGIGFHVWLPGAYAEADDDVSTFFSAILSKAAVYGLLLAILVYTINYRGGFDLRSVLGWIGALTAIFGALMAVFQEDIKRLLAYSSMSQLGYIVLALAMADHLGWTAALYITVLHVMFKGMLFLAVAGIVHATGTRLMYRMGGLIKKMPLSFISVLIAIIAVSGVPPLAGFGAKWMLYTGLIQRGWYLRAGIAFFSSAVAFLYLFRLIHSMFLGQLKVEHREVKEASPWLIAPQFALLIGIMVVSMFPTILLKPLSAILPDSIPGQLAWQEGTLLSNLGYWNGSAVMWVTMGVFMLVLLWLILWLRQVKKVGQFNIVYAAEKPFIPETTHYAYNFFPYYQKALGGLIKPRATSFWNGVSEWTASTAGAIRQIYTGNAQTYAMQIFLYIIVLYFIVGVGL